MKITCILGAFHFLLLSISSPCPNDLHVCCIMSRNDFLGGRRLYDMEKVLKQGLSSVNLALRHVKLKDIGLFSVKNLTNRKGEVLLYKNSYCFNY